MANLLILDLAGGNDSDILEAALARGDHFTFLTSDLNLYQKQAHVSHWVEKAQVILEIPDFNYNEVEKAVLAAHQRQAFDAIVCLLDIRLVDAAKLAHRLGLKYLNPQSAALLRNKFKVRERLQERGIEQLPFKLATTNAELQQAVAEIGLPALIKPADGYASQNIFVLKDKVDLDPWLTPLNDMLPSRTDYGLGVKANDKLLVERFMTGKIVGCDTVTVNGQHQLLGVNEKIFYQSPSFAIKGGCFIPNQSQFSEIEAFAKKLLTAVDYDFGFAHIEMMLTEAGPQLIEINPRLVGAKIGRMISMALETAIYRQLIELHLGLQPTFPTQDCHRVSVSRWLVADAPGVIANIKLPKVHDVRVRSYEMFKKKGDRVKPAFENADRIGYVMSCASSREEAEQVAEEFIANCQLEFLDCPH